MMGTPHQRNPRGKAERLLTKCTEYFAQHPRESCVCIVADRKGINRIHPSMREMRRSPGYLGDVTRTSTVDDVKAILFGGRK